MKMSRLCTFLALLCFTVVAGDPRSSYHFECSRLRPITVIPHEVEGAWYGQEIYKNVGDGREYQDSSSMCLGANVTAINSTRLQLNLYSLNATGTFASHDDLMTADIDADGKVIIEEGIAHEQHIIIAEKEKRYLTVAFCNKDGWLVLLTTYRYSGHPDLTREELVDMHDIIKTNLGVEKLQPGRLHCRSHGRH